MIKLGVYGRIIPTYLEIDKGHLKDHFHAWIAWSGFNLLINWIQYRCGAESFRLCKEA